MNRIHLMTIGKKPKIPLEKYKLTLIRYSSRCPDYDGLVGSFKIVVDALIENKIIKDDNFKMSGKWDVSWQFAKEGKIFIGIK